MLVFCIFVVMFVNCDESAMWGQSGKDSRSSSHIEYAGTKDNWLKVFPNETELTSKIMFDPKMNRLYFFQRYELVGLDPDTGKIVFQKDLLCTWQELWEFSDAVPVLDKNGVIWYLSPFNDPVVKGTYASTLVGISPDMEVQTNVTGAFWVDNDAVVHDNVLIYTTNTYDPYEVYTTYDLVALKLDGKNVDYLWVKRHVFDDNNLQSGLVVSNDGYLYFKNKTFNGFSSFAKIDIQTGKIVATQKQIKREIDSKAVVSSTLNPNRICFGSRSAGTLDTKNGQTTYNRFISCLNAETMEMIFDVALPPKTTNKEEDIAQNNPSLSLDEKEIYLKSGQFGDDEQSEFFVISSDTGSVIENFKREGDSCIAGDVPIAVFHEKSKYRFVVVCNGGDMATMFIMDREGKVRSQTVGDVSNDVGQNIHLVTDNNDCVYYCWTTVHLGYHSSKDQLSCARKCF